MRKLILILFVGWAVNLTAKVTLQPLFSSNMVLQQKSEAPIWGKAKANKKVTVLTSWDGKKYETTADADGRWKLFLSTPEAGGPYEITISDGTPTVLSNVLIGEVWLCTGQSNMEMPLKSGDGLKVLNHEAEAQDATNHPNIRLLHVDRATSTVPTDELNIPANGWQVCSQGTIHDFSAAGYFFGRELEKHLDVPVGLIMTCWGGTDAKAWTSREAIATMPSLRKELATVDMMIEKNLTAEQLMASNWDEWNADSWNVEDEQIGDIKAWTTAELDDKAWTTAHLPGLTDKYDLQGYAGIYWARKTINLPASWRKKALTLELGMVDDHDITFVNGQEVGRNVGVKTMRKYTIPAELTAKGTITVAIRITNAGGSTGIYGKRGHLVLSQGKKTMLLDGDWKLKKSLALSDLPALPKKLTNYICLSSLIHNAMLAPLVPFKVKGAIWYQGEANVDRSYQYRELLPLMINDWRRLWNDEFPFYIVQLANYMERHDVPTESEWAELREAQAMTTAMSNTALATAIDIGEGGNIHPANKQEVGRRLALAARALTYGEDIEYSGPQFAAYRIEGNKIRLKFSHAETGLTTKNGEAVKGFAVAGLDHQFHWATAQIEGNDVVVTSEKVDFPIAVRYAWADNPECNVYNGAGLPMYPFRTDDWPGLSFGKE